jgi:hypothetical protein
VELAPLTIEKREETTKKEFVYPESPYKPLLFLNRKPEGDSFEASFSIRLTGVRRHVGKTENYVTREKNEEENTRYLQALTDSLRAGQGVDVVYSISEENCGSRNCDIRLTGTASSKSYESCIEDAFAMYDGANVVLKTLDKEYGFSPVTTEEELVYETNGPLTRWVLEPVPVSIQGQSRQNIGFHNGSVETDDFGYTIIISETQNKKKDQRFDALIKGLKGFWGPLRFTISIHHVTLATKEREAIGKLLDGLKNGRMYTFVKADGSEVSVEGVQQVKGLVNAFLPWQHDHSGYAIRCTVESENPVPQSLLSMIGKEIYGTGQMRMVPFWNNEARARQASASENGNCIDLSSYFHMTIPLPPLFPRPELLGEFGVNKIYHGNGPVTTITDGIELGVCGPGQKTGKIIFSDMDRRRHCYTIGASGTGKSTLLYSMIMQDINRDEGVTVIDPHGDLYDSVLKSIPEKRIKDVVLFNPCDFEYSVGLNFLETSNGEYVELEMNYAINEMIEIFDRLYDLRTTGGPMFEQYMRNTMSLCIDNDIPGRTLVDVVSALENKRYRQFLLKHCRNHYTRNFWKNQAGRATGDASLENIVPYITSKLNQFVQNSLIRPIVGQPQSTVQFRDILDTGKILLVNLSKGLLGDLDGRLLGMLITGKVFGSAMSRIAMPEADRRIHYIYIDEFQNYTTDSIAYLISEARKFGLSLTISHQNLSQLNNNKAGKQNVLDSVLGNTGTILMFRTGIVDADKMEAYTKPEFVSGDLRELPDFHVAARMLVNNIPYKPFVFRTKPMPKMTRAANVDMIISQSRERYAVPRKLAENDMMSRLSKFDEMVKIVTASNEKIWVCDHQVWINSEHKKVEHIQYALPGSSDAASEGFAVSTPEIGKAMMLYSDKSLSPFFISDPIKEIKLAIALET